MTDFIHHDRGLDPPSGSYRAGWRPTASGLVGASPVFRHALAGTLLPPEPGRHRGVLHLGRIRLLGSVVSRQGLGPRRVAVHDAAYSGVGRPVASIAHDGNRADCHGRPPRCCLARAGGSRTDLVQDPTHGDRGDSRTPLQRADLYTGPPLPPEARSGLWDAWPHEGSPPRRRRALSRCSVRDRSAGRLPGPRFDPVDPVPLCGCGEVDGSWEVDDQIEVGLDRGPGGQVRVHTRRGLYVGSPRCR